MVRLCVFVSGGGTNLQALLDAVADGTIDGEIALVLSSRKDAYALTRAQNAGVPTVVIRKKDFPDDAAFEAAQLAALSAHRIDGIVLAGYLSTIGGAVLSAYPDRILNIHPSLLPAFGGAGFYGLRVHEAALARGVKLSGATVHLVNEVVDGGYILAQKAVPVLPEDTPTSLQQRIMQQAEWPLITAATKALCRAITKQHSITMEEIQYS